MSHAMIAEDVRGTRRRIWAVIPYVAFVVAAGAFWVTGRIEGPGEIIAAVSAALATVVMLVSAYGVYRWRREWAHRPDEELDEMQRAKRDRAYRSAYATLATVGALVVVGSQIALDLIVDLSITEISSIVVIGWFVLALCLPNSVLMWQEEDLDLEDVVAGRR